MSNDEELDKTGTKRKLILTNRKSQYEYPVRVMRMYGLDNLILTGPTERQKKTERNILDGIGQMDTAHNRGILKHLPECPGLIPVFFFSYLFAFINLFYTNNVEKKSSFDTV